MMFQSFGEYPRIVVSGPHRSGTTICAQMIAADTGLRFVPEEDFGFSDEARFRAELQRGGVLQAPFMAHLLHTLPKDVLVVWMVRGTLAVIRSQQRMRDAEGKQVGAGISKYRAHQFHCDGSDLVPLYETWEEQKPRIAHWQEIVYDNLREHPLWAAERTHFHHRQTG